MRKHGIENFSFSELCSVLDEKFLDELEIEFIKEHNSFVRGYNSSAGGGSTSPETRKLLSKIFKGRTVTWGEKIGATRKARKYDMSYVARGAANSNAVAYRARTPNGVEVLLKGLRTFCKERGLSHNLMLATLQGTQRHHKGYVLLERFNDQLERA